MTLEFRPVSETFVVSGQITIADVAEIAEHGFKTLICNRPDGEAPDQTGQAEIAKAAAEAGMAFLYIPVSPAGMTQQNVADTKAALEDAKTPIFAYCRSGARSTNLYAFSSGS